MSFSSPLDSLKSIKKARLNVATQRFFESKIGLLYKEQVYFIVQTVMNLTGVDVTRLLLIGFMKPLTITQQSVTSK